MRDLGARLCLSPLCAVSSLSHSASWPRSVPALYTCMPGYSHITNTFSLHKHTHSQIPANCCSRWPALLSPSSNYPRWDTVSTTTAATMSLPMSYSVVFLLVGKQCDSKLFINDFPKRNHLKQQLRRELF